MVYSVTRTIGYNTEKAVVKHISIPSDEMPEGYKKIFLIEKMLKVYGMAKIINPRA